MNVDAYSNPDRDYYSQFRANLSKTTRLPSGAAVSFGFAGRAELDRPEIDGSTPRLGDGDNIADILVGYSSEQFALTLRKRFGDIGANAATNSTTLAMNFEVNPRLAVNFEVTPQSSEDSYIVASAGFAWETTEAPDAPTLRVQWSKIEYGYGTDGVGQRLETSEHTVLAALQMKF